MRSNIPICSAVTQGTRTNGYDFRASAAPRTRFSAFCSLIHLIQSSLIGILSLLKAAELTSSGDRLSVTTSWLSKNKFWAAPCSNIFYFTQQHTSAYQLILKLLTFLGQFPFVELLSVYQCAYTSDLKKQPFCRMRIVLLFAIFSLPSWSGCLLPSKVLLSWEG